MKPSVYLETSVVSYLTAWLSRDMIVAAHQQLTQDWWRRRRNEFDLFVSQIVVREAEKGDPDAAERRLEVLADIPLVELNEDIFSLAAALKEQGPIPPTSGEDALHIATATVHGMDFLLTWNCTHIANARIRVAVEQLCRARGYRAPVICTPEELLGE